MSSPIDSDRQGPSAARQQIGSGLLDAESKVLLDREISVALEQLDGSAPLLSQMVRFHLGLIDSVGEPTSVDERRNLQGKRLRSALAMLSGRAIGGTAEDAAPLAAAIELLHNFTLIHDDIQDRSPNRRHRATVWRIWGDAQAINAGDALFAVSHLTLLRTPTSELGLEPLLELTKNFNATTIDIVRGQVMDVGFEGRSDVTPEQYLEMIRGKTAAIFRFAAAGGAIVARANEKIAGLFAEFGEALGIGFQITDDFLGIWGENNATGKMRGDDIRRRKQSLPLLLLRAGASPEDRDRLATLAKQDEIPEDSIAEVLAMLDRYGVRRRMERQIAVAHERATGTFQAIGKVTPESSARDELEAFVHRLEHRDS